MKQWLLVGLGNPGQRFANSRHNLGARLLRAWVSARTSHSPQPAAWKTRRRLPALLATVTLAAAPATCLIPLTPMNRSGQPVRRLLRRGFFTMWQKRPAYRLLIIHDDIDTPLGTFRLKTAGSARGHNGVRSIQAALHTTDFPR
ncbi:MAG: peptidyl-tRNA hydrolase, partial [Candidatus Andersenbacteria bacterium]|nr:peptidyl-tRNA hydrolase [Candidatus Andersenbacteria bacterium]